MIIPPGAFPLGTPGTLIRWAAAERAPLRGTVRVIVVLVDFSDQQMAATAQHFKDLFFSTGVLPHGSVKEFYKEASNDLVDITGEVLGTYRMPNTLGWYANGNFGINKPPTASGTSRARDLAHDAAVAADPEVNFQPYDNDGNGYVDAFIVVHAGRGGEETNNSNDIWSHKSVLPSEYATDATKIYGYLTVPEDARIGVCAHELGHLLFGFPDLYDVDDTSEGIGNWCLMSGGTWNGGGDVPAHPSGWCKANQGWASVTNVTTGGPLNIADVKTSHDILRLWNDGTGGQEYFLVENRQRSGFDADLPGDGLLIWHIDEAQDDNTNENHYKVGLVQADGKRDLEFKHNRGDDGDPYPGSAGNHGFSATSTPSSKRYAGQSSCVSLTNLSASAATMSADVSVHCRDLGAGLKQVFSDGQGMDNGDLLWYRHDGRGDGSFRWASDTGQKVGNGWSPKQIFSGGDGVIYAVMDNGDLLWYRHDGRGDGSFTWASGSGNKVGNGWSPKQIFSGGDGIIYAEMDNGDLLWYRHDGRGDGSFRWASDTGQKVGNGWSPKHVFSGGPSAH